VGEEKKRAPETRGCWPCFVMSRHTSLSTIQLSKIVLNVYDLNESNEMLYPWGLGMFHSGVQIGGNEWTFASGSGIFSHDPRGAGGAKFREAIEMGEFKGTQSDLDRALDELRETFKGTSYHVLTMNCNSFADALVSKILHKNIPAWVNRLATIGAFFNCLLPPQLGDAPVVQQVSSNRATPFSGEGRRLLNSVGEAEKEEDATERKEKIREATLARFRHNGPM